MLQNTWQRHFNARSYHCRSCSFNALDISVFYPTSSWPVLLRIINSRLGTWPVWWGSLSFKGVLVTQRSVPHPERPIASKVIQNVRLCVMIFPDSWLARFAHVTPQISPDNTLRHSGWSHSPDLAAPANSGEERKQTFLLICSICWKRSDSPTLAPSVAPIDFEPFVLLGPWIASPETAGIVHTDSPNTISYYEVQKHVKSPKDVTDSSALFGTMLSHLCCSVALIAFVIEGWLNQAVAPPNEMLIRDSETHSPLIWCYFSRKMRIIFANATC